MTTTTETTPTTEEQAGALVGRLFEGSVHAWELLTIYLGTQLGLYRALVEQGPQTAPELAKVTGIDPRYAREWLEQQATAQLIDVDDPAAAPDERRYTIPEATAIVLTDEQSLFYVAPLGDFTKALGATMPRIVEAFRTGGGVSWAEFGEEGRRGQAAFNRPAFQHLLASDWLANGLPDVHARLESDQPARVADVACGFGWSSVAIAKAYPNVRVEGFDLDEPSVDAANRIAEEAGLASRATFEAVDVQQLAEDPERAGTYDFVCIFEALHDMSRPVEVLSAINSMLAPGGSLLVMDERVADEFGGATGEPVERFMYAASVLCCLPAGLSEQPSAATGTVMRPATLRSYAEQAGYSKVEEIQIEDAFHRFYRLQP